MNKDSMYILIFIAFFGTFASFAIATDQNRAKEQQQAQPCRNGYKRSAPACWNEADWNAYCEHVGCK